MCLVDDSFLCLVLSLMMDDLNSTAAVVDPSLGSTTTLKSWILLHHLSKHDVLNYLSVYETAKSGTDRQNGKKVERVLSAANMQSARVHERASVCVVLESRKIERTTHQKNKNKKKKSLLQVM